MNEKSNFYLHVVEDIMQSCYLRLRAIPVSIKVFEVFSAIIWVIHNKNLTIVRLQGKS